MPRCLSCSADNPDRNRFCGVCGAAIGSASEAPTEAIPPRGSSDSQSDEGRFPAGTILAERYRVIGQGGMGEVYRKLFKENFLAPD
jgi:hypothetical protein